MNISPQDAVYAGRSGFVPEGQRRNLLPLTLFLSLFLAPFLAKHIGGLGRLTDGVIAVITMAVIWRMITARRAWLLPVRYVLVFLLFVYVVAGGLLLNHVESLVTIAGIRSYFRYVPLFLLPFAFQYSEEDLRWQFSVLMGLALLQFPVTVWQRFIKAPDVFTGDGITGTLNVSNSLSIVMVCLITVLATLYLRRSISLKVFLFSSVLLFFPCTLNETKVTVFLLPIGIVSTLFIMRREIPLKNILTLLVSSVLLLGTFVAVYDYLYTRDVGFVSLVADEDRMLDSYNMTGNRAAPDALRERNAGIVGAIKSLREEDSNVGRFDSFQIAFNALLDYDPTRFLIGLGIGNVDSSIGRGGSFKEIDTQLGGTATALALLLWETGLAGTVLYIVFLLLIARDSLVLSGNKTGWGTLGTGWFGVTLIIVATLPYNTLFHLSEVVGLFTYFSGMVVYGQRMGRNA